MFLNLHGLPEQNTIGWGVLTKEIFFLRVLGAGQYGMKLLTDLASHESQELGAFPSCPQRVFGMCVQWKGRKFSFFLYIFLYTNPTRKASPHSQL